MTTRPLSGAIHLACALAALSLTAFSADKDSGVLTIEIPAAVQETIKKEKGEARVHDFRRVNEGDGATYVVGLTLDGKNYSLTLDALGRVMRKELDEERRESFALALDAVPASIRKVFEREAGGATIKEIDVREPRKTYAAEIVVAGRRYVIEVGDDGRLLKKEYVGEEEREVKP